jgi:hypothetical protein
MRTAADNQREKDELTGKIADKKVNQEKEDANRDNKTLEAERQNDLEKAEQAREQLDQEFIDKTGR